MAGLEAARAALALLVPPRCGGCGAMCDVRAPVCDACREALGRCRPRSGSGEPPWWSAGEYAGVARDVVRGLKFGRLLPLADAMAAVIAQEAPPGLLSVPLVPVPAAPRRLRGRGFDPASLLAGRLGRLTGLPVLPLLVRDDGPRQGERTRRERISSAPRVAVREPPPEAVVLVDDVVTTGATLHACARALLAAGCRDARAATFAWTPVREALGRTAPEA